MSLYDQDNDVNVQDNSKSTLEPLSKTADGSLLDQLVKKLHTPSAAPLPTAKGDRTQELEARLADRDRLVSILTDRLEQAANELDRVKRSGGGLANNSAGGTDLASLLEGQGEVATALNRFVNQWEERYEGPALRRMETGIEELRQRLEQTTIQSHPPESNTESEYVSPLEAFSLESTGEANAEATVGTDPENADDDTAVACQPAYTLDDPVRIVLISREEVPDDLDVDLPKSIDESDVSEQQLRQAVTDRDAYITWLCHRVRQITGRLETWLSELRRNSDDSALHKRIGEIEQLIRDQLRVAEIEVSIERARLSREQSQLLEATQRLAHKREQLPKALEASDEAEDTALLRRWKKFLTPGEA